MHAPPCLPFVGRCHAVAEGFAARIFEVIMGGFAAGKINLKN